MLDLLAACIIVQLLADGWMWQLVNQYRDVPLLAILNYPSDVLLGFATGLAAVVLTCLVFYAAGINLHQANSKSLTVK